MDRRSSGTRVPRGLVGAALLAAVLTCGCALHDVRSLHRVEVPAQALASQSPRNRTLAAHLHDGSLVVFDDWALADSARVVRGSGRRLDPDRRLVDSSVVAVAVDSVALFETSWTGVPAALAPLTLVTSASIALSVGCLTHPKACFGSCPTFYADLDGRPVLVAEGFSASVAPALEAADLDALDRLQARAGRLRLTMTNEALETHVVRHADLLLVGRADGERVVADAEGALWSARGWLAPDSARGAEGDCRGELAARDARERTSLADSLDLAASEYVELSFARAPPGARGLVVVARQSLLSTYVFYQGLAWMGRSAGRWLASLANADAGELARIRGPAQALGAIEVQVPRDGGWRTVGVFHETGPLACDTRLVSLPTDEAGPLRVRLRMARGMWRLDQVALVSIGDRRQAERLPPVAVWRGSRPDGAALASLRSAGPPLVTLPGDTLAIEYELPAADRPPELFLESRGYYLEWMRNEWIAEENPERLAQLFLAPRAALRRMAPEFKRREPELERAFWGSRHAR